MRSSMFLARPVLNGRLWITGLALIAILGAFATGALAQQQGRSAARVSVDARLSRTAVPAGDTVRAAVVLEIDEGWHANAHKPTLEYLIGTALTTNAPEGVTVDTTEYPEPEMFSFSFAGNQKLAVYSGRTPIFLTLRISPGLQPGRRVLKGSLRIQICSDSVCLPPSTLPVTLPIEVTADPSEGRPTNQALFSEEDSGSLASQPTPGSAPGATTPGVKAGTNQASTNQIASMFDQRGLLLAYLGIFVIGLALNLTPCVYPMMSVTVSLFGTQKEDRLARSFGRASIYVLGIATMYSVLGTIAAVTGGLFGAALQSPWVLGGISALLFGMALGMFGAYELQPPVWLRERLSGAQQTSGLAGVYLSGLVVGVFAAPCIGPPTVALLAFVGSQGDPIFGLSAFTVMGLGLGAPYLVLGTFGGLLNRLPSSGVWMMWVKKLFGVVMVGAALFYLGLAVVPDYAIYAVPATLAGGGLYLGFLERSGRSGGWFRRVKWAVGAAALVGSIAIVQILQEPSIEWQPYSDDALTQAQQASRPALLYFSADWCVPCIELDRTTFTDDEVIGATSNFVRLKADLTRYGSPEAKALRERFNVAGVPTLVFLDGSGKEITQSRTVGYVGSNSFLKRVHAAESTLSDSTQFSN
ncbi:protein-disulfide reductase DsbD family protein [Salinibacter ruber]|uniref:protein-disulfide reductase DsbD family protein n=1 Tax=Salinibacter ruber TaxID=146919 RepID=UPI000E590AB8|nr:cytochrome c biogenesis protein CcdA [Salinibacter ruber]